MKDWALGIALSLLAVLTPIKPLLVSVGFLIFADAVSGILAARKRGEKISSSKLRSTISKTFIYQICIISAFVMEKYLISDAMPIAKIVAAAAGVVELKSLLENANQITGINVFDAIKSKLGSPNLPKE